MRFGLLALACALAGSPLYAQPQTQPIGPFVVDVRGAFARHKDEPSVAHDLGVVPGNMPTHSFGFVAGAHWYPWHTRHVTFGLGGEAVLARGSKTLDPVATAGTTTSTPMTSTPTVKRHFSAVSPQFSFNFGARNGYSYISGGIGLGNLYADREDHPATGVASRKTINYGAGARWFANHHVAVSFDLRWYSVTASPATATAVATPRTTLLLLSGGVALR